MGGAAHTHGGHSFGRCADGAHVGASHRKRNEAGVRQLVAVPVGTGSKLFGSKPFGAHYYLL